MDFLFAKTVRRVPLDFDWPTGQPWHGYINPWPGPLPCPTCEGFGYNDATMVLYRSYDAWASKVTKREAKALLGDEYEFHQEDIDHLQEGMTGDEDPLLRFALVQVRAKRKKVWGDCFVCDGIGEVPNYHPSVMALYEGVDLYSTWQPVDPPVGKGWQFWDSDGIPLSPVFASPADLAKWCCDAHVGVSSMPVEAWTQWILSVKDPPAQEPEERHPFRLMGDYTSTHLVSN